MASGYADSHTVDYSQDHKLSKPDAGLDFNMEQELWSVAFILAPLKTRLDFFHGETDRDGTLEENPLNFTSLIQLSRKPHPLAGTSGNVFLTAPQELHVHR